MDASAKGYQSLKNVAAALVKSEILLVVVRTYTILYYLLQHGRVSTMWEI